LLKLEIKAELVKRGITFKQIASEQKVKPLTVSIVLKGDRRSRCIEQAIAAKIGRTVEEVFPDRYVG
jgi:lambda repressor-like predicted transcriptional regulator